MEFIEEEHPQHDSANSGSSSFHPTFVSCGDALSSESGVLMGHGSMQSADAASAGQLVATVAGFVERVNKLISVRPLHTRYGGEVGDVIVGRIMEVADKHWKVDVGGRQHAILLLSSVNLPGGVQRRRTAEDSLNMRSFFTENDVISAEVQKLRHDGCMSLHTRNLKYGKLSNGALVSVSPNLVKRCKQHFQRLGEEVGVEVILGLNGLLWVQECPVERVAGAAAAATADGVTEDGSSATYVPVTPAGRERVVRVRNCILALSRANLPIWSATIVDAYVSSVQAGMAAKEIIAGDESIAAVTHTARERTRG